MNDKSHRQDAAAGAEAHLRPEPAREAPGDEAPQDPVEASPTGLQVADSWAEAADPTGTVEATRRMPEPDSLGG